MILGGAVPNVHGGCLANVGIPIHEFMHSIGNLYNDIVCSRIFFKSIKYIFTTNIFFFLFIGYFHEQSRADRDKYVTINWDNIPNDPGARFQFEKCGHCDSQNGPYDFNSIMHYGPKDWSINGQNTIDSKTGDSFGPGNGFSEQDLKDINDFYCGMLRTQWNRNIV